jgi:hypothetical protein
MRKEKIDIKKLQQLIESKEYNIGINKFNELNLKIIPLISEKDSKNGICILLLLMKI